MSTTVHIPERLLKRVDARAKALGKSRNKLIVEAIEATFDTPREWPPELVAMLAAPLDARSARALEESLADIRSHRRNRRKHPAL